MESLITKALDGLTIYDLILFLTSGFVFVNVFDFTIEVDWETRKNHNFISLLLIGFVLKNAISVIPIRTRIDAVDISIFILICILLGYSLGRVYLSDCFISLLSKLKIRSTPQSSIWSTITKDEDSLWAEIGFKSIDLKYYGIAQVIEEGQRFPQIALYGYIKGNYDLDLKTSSEQALEDFSEDMSKFVLLNVEKADYVEFVSTKSKTRK